GDRQSAAPPALTNSANTRAGVPTNGLCSRGARSGANTANSASLLVFHVHVLSVDHAFVLLLFGLRLPIPRSAAGRLRRVGLVQHLGKLVAGLRQFFLRGLHFAHLGSALQRLLGFGKRRLHLGLVRRLHLF